MSDIVLVEDDFRSIPQGIVEGRRILLNIRRVAKLFVVKSAFAATLILTVGVAGAAYPLLPRQLSFAALFTVGLPALRAGDRAVHGPAAEAQLHDAT